MKKSTVYFLLSNVLFAALAVYFALESSDFSAEGRESRAHVLKLRKDNRGFYTTKEEMRLLEKINSGLSKDAENLLGENAALKNAILAKDNDLEKMKLFSREQEKSKRDAEAQKALAENELAAAKSRVAELENAVDKEKKHSDELNGELVRARNLIKDLEISLATKESELENLREDYFAVETELNISRERIKTLEEDSWF